MAVENFGKFGELNVIRQYFYPTKFILIFENSWLPDKMFTCAWVEYGGVNLSEKMSILKYLHPLAEAEAKFDPAG